MLLNPMTGKERADMNVEAIVVVIIIVVIVIIMIKIIRFNVLSDKTIVVLELFSFLVMTLLLIHFVKIPHFQRQRQKHKEET